jgi:seryl-tRNA synthetase
VKQATRVKRVANPETVDDWLAADAARRNAQAQSDNLRAEQNKLGEQVGKLKRELRGQSSPELDKLLAAANDIKEKQDALNTERTAAETEAQRLMLLLPAIPDPSWPVGKDDTENVVARTWADPAHPPLRLDGGRKDHIVLSKELGLVDFERGVKLAGSRSYVVRGPGAQLYWAVLRFAQDLLVRRGYEPMVVPVLVTEECMIGTGYFPTGRDQAYITQDGTALVGTSEVSLASFYGGEILELEQVVVHRADDAEHIQLHEEIIANAESILQALKLPYRVSQNCTGDMGQGKWRMYDIETWMPSRNGYGETHSGSALRDFQSRRLNLRYRDKAAGGKGETRFCYTLNNTAIACPRVLISILEQYQNADGSVTVPDALRPFMDGVEKIANK